MLSREAELLNARLNPSILEVLSAKGRSIYFPKEGIISQSAEAAGKKINATMGIAVEDDGTPMRLSSIASKVFLDPVDVFTYASSYGKPQLRTAWKESIYNKNPSLRAKISTPVVTNALTHGLSVAGYLFVDKTDRIILPDKNWENYNLIFKEAYGAVMDTYNTFSEGCLDIGDFRRALSAGIGKKIVLLNFPNNPSGYTPTYDEALEIVSAIRDVAEAGDKIVVMVDDAYFGFVYEDGIYKESIFSMLADLHENVLAVKLDGATKESYAWGLRVGFITFGFKGATEEDYKVLEDKAAAVVRGSISNAPHLSQSLVLNGLKLAWYEREKEDKFKILKSRYEKVKEVLSNPKYSEFFRPLPFNSGYFMCLEVKEAEKVRKVLLSKYDTGVITFGNLIRVAFSAVPEARIEELFENIYKACRETAGIYALMDDKSRQYMDELNNPHVFSIIEKYAKLCKPASIKILDDAPEDIAYTRNLALNNCEESRLTTPGHTVHYDGYFDQGRDKEKTKVLVLENKLGNSVNTGDRTECLKEMKELLEGSMKDREMLVQFFCLGPENSRFALGAMQITDSAYVIHSENILYRNGFHHFKQLNGSGSFFHFVHASGELENGVSKNPDKKRIYIDLEENRVFSVNTQYAGNSIGLKKLALRLAIHKANNEDWLTEHMFIMGVNNKGRRTYFCGAFPSACGKTSTAMIPGQSIVGDDIAYLRKKDGRLHAVNIEQGIFGILQDVNPVDDPLIYQTLVTPRELIFSNVLSNDKQPYWLGMGKPIPDEGVNYSGLWVKGMQDYEGNEILAAHKNARYTMRLEELDNVDENLHNPEGLPVSAIIYGGRDSDTSPPVVQSFDWQHGVFVGASLESETTAATIGQAGLRKHDPMAISDFLVVPIGQYLSNHLKIGTMETPPVIFSTNYFLKENGLFLNEKVDKKIWLLWMEGRVNGEFDAIETPIGYIPKYEDLRQLFLQVFDKDYSRSEYEQQFSIKISKSLERLERIDKIYVPEEIPEEIFLQIDAQRTRLINARREFKKDVISPFDFENGFSEVSMCLGDIE